MEDIERAQIEQACRDLVVKLNYYGDHRMTEEAVALFAEDGTWMRGGKPLQGHAQLRDSYRRASPSQVTRHFAGNPFVTVLDESHAEAVTYYLAMHHDAGTPDAKLPLPFDPPNTLGEWHDRFVRTASGWRFAARETKRVFTRGAGH